jgi:hypothetical protein
MKFYTSLRNSVVENIVELKGKQPGTKTDLRRNSISPNRPIFSRENPNKSTERLSEEFISSREKIALSAAQRKSSSRLASLNKSEGNLGAVGNSKEFRYQYLSLNC